MGKKKIDSSYWVGLIIGGLLLLICIGLFCYSNHKYSDWESVKVSYGEYNVE